MPKLNLKDENLDDTGSFNADSPAPPTLRDVGGSGGGGISPILQVLIAVIVLGGITFALNYFGVIHLWGKKQPTLTSSLPEPLPPVIEEQFPAQTETPAITETQQPKQQTTVPITKPTQTKPPELGTGQFTVQVSAWQSKSKADAEVAKLVDAGLPGFVAEEFVGGTTWYRVRVGRYGSRQEASQERERLQLMLADQLWVAQVSK